MSRSTRRPYLAVTGATSAKIDKRIARRAVRHAQNRMLGTRNNLDDLLLPHPLECNWNDPWSWDRDGKQTYRGDWRISPEEKTRRLYRKLLRK